MKANGVKRFIWATGAGVTAEQDQPTLMNKFINFLLKLTVRKVLKIRLLGLN